MGFTVNYYISTDLYHCSFFFEFMYQHSRMIRNFFIGIFIDLLTYEFTHKKTGRQVRYIVFIKKRFTIRKKLKYVFHQFLHS